MKSKLAWVLIFEDLEKPSEKEISKIENDLRDFVGNHRGLRFEDAYEY